MSLIWRNRRQVRREEEAARRVKREERTIEKLLDGHYSRLEEEYGVNFLTGTPFGPPLPKRPGVDGGEGREQEQVFDNRNPSQTLSDDLRATLANPARQAERRRLKRGGSNDARHIPEDTPTAISYPRVPWER